MSLRSKINYIALLAAFEVVFLIIVWNGHPQAEEMSVKAEANETFVNEDFRDWLETLRDEARAAGISDTTLDAALRDIQLATRVIERDRRQLEFTQTFWNYLGKSSSR